MDVNAEIVSIKAKLVELEQQLLTATGDREREHDLRNQITAKEYQLTELYKHLPTTSGKNSDFPLVSNL
jgi:hypothetical protein